MSDVVHAEERSRFEVVEDEHRAVLTYVRTDDQVVLEHTVVPPELGGRGLGSDLARAALEWAREQGLAVVPQCTFVQSFLAKHPEAAEGMTLRRAAGG
jgi:uncharacterized protein